MKIYRHDNLSLHTPLSYFSYGEMFEPLEIPERMTELLKAPVTLNLEVTEAVDFGIAPILAVHDFGYVQFLKHGYDEWMTVEEDLGAQVQTGIFVPYDKPDIGFMVNATESLLNDDVFIAERSKNKTQLCFARPPEHHARKSAAGKFCYLNNVTIIAEHPRQKCAEIAIIDTDMHHGQGIQKIFYDCSDVLYTSVHASPINFYPAVTGHEFKNDNLQAFLSGLTDIHSKKDR